MDVINTAIPGVLILKPRIFSDERGHFFESHNQREFVRLTGIDVDFVQDNQSRSRQGVLRGLHYQNPQAQGKLVRVLEGEIFDVVVDLRRDAATFGQSLSLRLSAENAHGLWVPPGFAHGFLVLSAVAGVLYKTTDYYAPQHERCIAWNDPELAIAWPLNQEPELSPKDRLGCSLRDAVVFK